MSKYCLNCKYYHQAAKDVVYGSCTHPSRKKPKGSYGLEKGCLKWEGKNDTERKDSRDTS